MEETSLPTSVMQNTHTFGLTLGYTPSGDEGQIFDKAGATYKWVQAKQQSHITIDASYRFTENLTTQLEAQLSRNSHQYAVGDEKVAQASNVVDSAWSAKGEIRFRLPIHDLAPEISLSGRYPWSVGAGISLSITNDPVIMQGAWEYVTSLTHPEPVMAASGRIAFIVNDNVSFLCAVRNVLATSQPRVPVTSTAFGVSYLLGAKTQNKVNVLTTNEVIGIHNRTGFLVKLQHDGEGRNRPGNV
jgi:hypothetical protein